MTKPLDMNRMQRSSRDARDEAETAALAKVDGKKRLRKNRTEAMTIRLTPQRRAQLVRLCPMRRAPPSLTRLKRRSTR